VEFQVTGFAVAVLLFWLGRRFWKGFLRFCVSALDWAILILRIAGRCCGALARVVASAAKDSSR
jgi:hypothetical protein